MDSKTRKVAGERRGERETQQGGDTKGTRGATDGIRKGKGGRERQRGGRRGEVRRQSHSDPFV